MENVGRKEQGEEEECRERRNMLEKGSRKVEGNRREKREEAEEKNAVRNG